MKTITLAVILLLAAHPLTAAPATARALPNLMPAPEFVMQHEKELALTSEQHAKLETAVKASTEAAQRADAAVRQESDALAVQLSAERPDEAAVQAQFEKVLAAENEVKRVRLKLSLITRAVLTPEQQGRIPSLQSRGARGRAPAPEQLEFTSKMERVKSLIERAKQEGRDLSAMRDMWRRVELLNQQGQTAEACRVLDEAAQTLAAGGAPASK